MVKSSAENDREQNTPETSNGGALAARDDRLGRSSEWSILSTTDQIDEID